MGSILIAMIAVGTGSPLASESSSASFRLAPGSLNAAGGETSSASYTLNASAAQRAAVGASSSSTFVLQSGLWSFGGSGLVPVLLTVERNSITVGNVDLSWSGNNSPYEVYESADCANVFGSLHDATPSNHYDNITPPGAALVCYSILATAPGPAPPPLSP